MENNRAYMLEKVDELFRRREKIKLGGGLELIERQHALNKLTAWERIDKLLDPGTFYDFGSWAKSQIKDFGMDKRETPADAVICGFGKIEGRNVIVYAVDFTVMAGAYGEGTLHKTVRALELGGQTGVPVIGLIDSAGVRFQESNESLYEFGRLFHAHSIYSGVMPQIVALMGPCVAGQAYSPVLADFLLMVRNASYMWLASPILTKVATGEEVTDVELGGPDVHMKKSGTCDLVAESDIDCLEKIRKLLSFLPQNYMKKPPVVNTKDDPNRREEGLLEVLPSNPRAPYDIRQIIYKVVDDADFFELKPDYAQNLVIGFARLNGRSVGIVANQPLFMAGGMEPDCSDKYTKFITICDAYNIPLITFVDTTGFLPGKHYEAMGVLRHGAKILHAYSVTTVPKIQVIIRRCYGGANMVMGSKGMGADLCLAWPTAEISPTGAEGAVAVIYRKEVAEAKNPEEERRRLEKEYFEKKIQVYVHAEAARYGLVDDVIDPRDTRRVLITALDALSNTRQILPGKRRPIPPQ